MRPRCLLLFPKNPTIHANPPSKSLSPFQIKPALKIFFISAIRKQINKQRCNPFQANRKGSKQTTIFHEEEEEVISAWSHAIAISASRDPARVKKLPDSDLLQAATAATKSDPCDPLLESSDTLWQLDGIDLLLQSNYACRQGQHSSTLTSLAKSRSASRPDDAYLPHDLLLGQTVYMTQQVMLKITKILSIVVCIDSSYNARLNLFMN